MNDRSHSRPSVGDILISFSLFPIVMPYVRQWFEAPFPHIGTKDFATTEKDFRNGWALVKTPAGGEGSIQRALERAVTLPPPPEIEQFRLPGVRW